MEIGDLLLGLIGLVAVLAAAAVGVRSASRLASAFGVSEVVIGATVVAIGTSAPELVVSGIAALEGADGVAIGNVVGSNVANVGLVLGLSAVLTPLAVHRTLITREIPLLLIATLTVLLLAANGMLGQAEGAVLVLWVVVYLYIVYRAPGPKALPEAAEVSLVDERRAVPWVDGGLIAISVVALAIGADVFVRSAERVALDLGVREFAIGATVAALGTSLPEIATSGMAAWRKKPDLAIANVVGSNIINLLGVLGLSALVAPIELNRRLYQFEFPLLLGSSLILFGLVWPGYQLRRGVGVALMFGYVAFVVATLWRAS